MHHHLPRRAVIAFLCLSFGVSLWVALFSISISDYREADVARDAQSSAAAAWVHEVQSTQNGIIAAAISLQGYVKSNITFLPRFNDSLVNRTIYFEEDTFVRVAGSVQREYPTASILGTIPSGVITQTHPPNIFPNYIDLSRQFLYNQTIFSQVSTGDVATIVASLPYYSNGAIIVGSLVPVYNSTSPDPGQFWGFTAALFLGSRFNTVTVAQVMNDSNIHWCLYCLEKTTRARLTIAGTHCTDYDVRWSGHTESIDISGSCSWKIAVTKILPKKHFTEENIVITAIVCFIGALLVNQIADHIYVLTKFRRQKASCAPKAHPYFYAVVSICNGERLWTQAPDDVTLITERFTAIVNKACEDHQTYASTHLAPHTFVITARRVSSLVETCFQVLDDASDFTYSPAANKATHYTFMAIAVMIHECEVGFISFDPNAHYEAFGGSFATKGGNSSRGISSSGILGASSLSVGSNSSRLIGGGSGRDGAFSKDSGVYQYGGNDVTYASHLFNKWAAPHTVQLSEAASERAQPLLPQEICFDYGGSMPESDGRFETYIVSKAKSRLISRLLKEELVPSLNRADFGGSYNGYPNGEEDDEAGTNAESSFFGNNNSIFAPRSGIGTVHASTDGTNASPHELLQSRLRVRTEGEGFAPDRRRRPSEGDGMLAAGIAIHIPQMQDEEHAGTDDGSFATYDEELASGTASSTANSILSADNSDHSSVNGMRKQRKGKFQSSGGLLGGIDAIPKKGPLARKQYIHPATQVLNPNPLLAIARRKEGSGGGGAGFPTAFVPPTVSPLRSPVMMASGHPNPLSDSPSPNQRTGSPQHIRSSDPLHSSGSRNPLMLRSDPMEGVLPGGADGEAFGTTPPAMLSPEPASIQLPKAAQQEEAVDGDGHELHHNNSLKTPRLFVSADGQQVEEEGVSGQTGAFDEYSEAEDKHSNPLSRPSTHHHEHQSSQPMSLESGGRNGSSEVGSGRRSAGATAQAFGGSTSGMGRPQGALQSTSSSSGIGVGGAATTSASATNKRSPASTMDTRDGDTAFMKGSLTDYPPARVFTAGAEGGLPSPIAVGPSGSGGGLNRLNSALGVGNGVSVSVAGGAASDYGGYYLPIIAAAQNTQQGLGPPPAQSITAALSSLIGVSGTRDPSDHTRYITVPPAIDEVLRRNFYDHLDTFRVSTPISYKTVRLRLYIFYRAYEIFFNGFQVNERRNIFHRLKQSLGVKMDEMLAQLAVRCLLASMRK